MPLDYPIHRLTLPNGLRVVVSPDHTVPNVTVNIWVGVGSRHEAPGRTGFAHLFEHLMFQGSRGVRSGEHFEALMAEGGRLNATTWFDRTNYFETVPTGAVELALWLEADRHGHLLDAVTQENLDNQRDVVKEEKRQRYDNQPYGTALIDVYATVFPEGHPYHHPTIGSMADLDAASLDDVHAFFRATTARTTPCSRCAATSPRSTGSRSRSGTSATCRRAPTRAAPTTPSSSPSTGRCGWTAARSCPTTGCTSPSASRSTRPTSSSPRRWRWTASAASPPRASSAGSCATSRPRSARTRPRGGSSTARRSASSSSTSRRARMPVPSSPPSSRSSTAFLDGGPTAVELESSLAQSERSWLSALASQEERADLLSHHLLLHDDPDVVNTHLDRLRAVTADDVVEAARRWLRPESRAVVAYLSAPDTADDAGGTAPVEAVA